MKKSMMNKIQNTKIKPRSVLVIFPFALGSSMTQLGTGFLPVS